jgi:hypothetical protein
MQQVMWETVFNEQFVEILENHGIDRSDFTKINSLKKQLNISRRSSCQLMIEVEENWKEKLTRLLKKDNSVHI